MSQDIPLYKLSEYWENSSLAHQFHLQRIEDGMCSHPSRRMLHRHDFFQLFWIGGGRGSFYSDLKHYSISKGTLFFVTPGQVHSWEDTSGVRGYAISFSSEFFLMTYQNQTLLLDLPFFYATQSAPVLHVRPKDQALFEDLLHRIENEFVSSPKFQDIVRSYLHILLLEAQRRYAFSPPAKSPEAMSSTVNRFVLLIEQKYKDLTSVKEYADILSLTPSYLNSVCKNETGRTAGMMIRDRVLLESKRLLAYSQLSISEISYQLRFEDPSYFGRFFKKYLRMSPGEFREAIHKKSQTSASLSQT